jgi:uncharacterized protein (DUF1697 family)
LTIRGSGRNLPAQECAWLGAEKKNPPIVESAREEMKTATSRRKPRSTLFVALLRGINVSGHNKIPMSELRSLCHGLGWNSVQSYIQSGNLVFTADGTPAALETQLETAIKKQFDFAIPVIVRSASEWPGYILGNPFPETSKNEPNAVMLILPKSAPNPDAAKALQERAANGERIAKAGDVLWIHFANGVAGSKISPSLLDRMIGSTATARNWNTVLKINELINSARQENERALVATHEKARSPN